MIISKALLFRSFCLVLQRHRRKTRRRLLSESKIKKVCFKWNRKSLLLFKDEECLPSLTLLHQTLLRGSSAQSAFTLRSMPKFRVLFTHSNRAKTGVLAWRTLHTLDKHHLTNFSTFDIVADNKKEPVNMFLHEAQLSIMSVGSVMIWKYKRAKQQLVSDS